MPSTPSLSEPDDGPFRLVLPLRKRTRAGEPYRRPPDVEHEIEVAVALDADALLQRVCITDSEPGSLKSETLAYLLRQAHAKGEDALVNAVAGQILVRYKRGIYGAFRAQGLDVQEALEEYQDFVGNMVIAITDPAGKGDFFQIRFERVLAKRLLTAKRHVRRQLKRDREHDGLLDPIGNGSEVAGESSLTLEETLGVNAAVLSPEDHIAVREALNAITDPRHRAAFVLHDCEGWQIEAIDPEKPCLSRYFNTTDRTIRNWLAKARAQVAAWRQEENAV